jgi:putative ABC transport system ATP-binding protein
VAIARAIVAKPRLLLADEPTGNLDSSSAGSVMELLCSLNAEGTAVCMVTHDPRYAIAATRTVSMLDGRIG